MLSKMSTVIEKSNQISSLESWIKGRAHVTFTQSGAKWPLFRSPLLSGGQSMYMKLPIKMTTE